MESAKNPKKKSLGGCVDDLIKDAKSKYETTVVINQSKRSPEQAQRFHVCHMFLYNMFKHLKPKHTDKGKKTISWEHMSDPDREWVLIADRGEFLKNAAGEAAKLDTGDGRRAWAQGFAPDRAASTKAMTQFLKSHRVASMAAPGVNHCGPPCACGGKASKHLTGEACDLGGLKELEAKIKKESKDQLTLDQYLESFSLYRPMAKYTDARREEWHVEMKAGGHPGGGRAAGSPHDGAGQLPAKHSGKAGLRPPGMGSPDARQQNAIIRQEALKGAKLA